MNFAITVVGNIAKITMEDVASVDTSGIVQYPTEDQSIRDDAIFKRGIEYNELKVAQQEEMIKELHAELRARELRIKELQELLANTRPKERVESDPSGYVKSISSFVSASNSHEENAKRNEMCRKAVKATPDHNGRLPPGVWLITAHDFNRLTGLALMNYLGGWVEAATENGGENLIRVYYVHVPDKMPKDTMSLTAYMKMEKNRPTEN